MYIEVSQEERTHSKTMLCKLGATGPNFLNVEHGIFY